MSNLYVKPWYPVGAILEFDRPMDMTAIYGGTWELFGAGRMTVGIDTGDEDFNKAGKTGGSKDYQKHTHIANMGDAGEHTHAKSFNQPDIYGYAMVTNRTGFGYAINSDTQTAYRIKEAYMSIEKNGNHSHRLTIGDAGTGNSGNMSPYVVVYRYRKVAN